jgi:uncharacterized membrane protein YbaN (DUF454 family)
MKKYLFLITGHLFLALGLIGAILPILPTTPFLLLAVFCYSKSNPKLHNWLLTNKYFGPSLQDWFSHRIIKTKAKIIATIMVSFIYFWRIIKLEILIYGKISIGIILAMVLIFIWTRPSGNQ